MKRGKTEGPSLNLPEFASMDEEREWWDTHHKEINDFIAHATKVGAVKRGPVIRAPEPTVQTTIRLFERDYKRLKAKAAEKGLRYQSYMKMLIHESLERGESDEKAS